MSDLIPFEFRGTRVRVVTIEGEPWFVGADVCFVLGYRNSRDAIAKHVRDSHRRVSRIATPSGDQDMTVISEPGLYRLMMRSNTVLADQFQDWVTDEVLPTIRKTGGYGERELSRLEIIDIAREAELARIEERAGRLAAEAQVAELKPGATAWAVLASADGDYSVADAAKLLSRDTRIDLGRERLFTVLHERGWIFRQPGDRRYRAYQTAVDTGRLSELPAYRTDQKTGERVLTAPKVRVTVKGLQELHRLLGGAAPLQIRAELALFDA